MVKDLKKPLRKSQKWKSPGIDEVSNFCLNAFNSIHRITNCFNKVIENTERNPKWFTQGMTYLQPKSNETNKPKNYRPITCLSTILKMLTPIITERTYSFANTNNILTNEQKGCKKGSYDCNDQLLINKTTLENSCSNDRNLSTAWMDYRKAFDTVPHSWILKV